MKDYQAITKAASSLGENKDCAVRAVTVVSNMPYKYVHRYFTQCGRRPRKGTPKAVTCRVLQELQIQTEDVTSKFRAKTVRTLGRELPKKGTFLIHTSGHLLAAKDGEIIDWTKGRLHRILRIERTTF